MTYKFLGLIDRQKRLPQASPEVTMDYDEHIDEAFCIIKQNVEVHPPNASLKLRPCVFLIKLKKFQNC